MTITENNNLISVWENALAARRESKAEFDRTYAAYKRKEATYEELGAAFDADREKYIALGKAHADAQAAYLRNNAKLS